MDIHTPRGANVYKGKSFLRRIAEFVFGVFFLLGGFATIGEPDVSGWGILFMVVIGLLAIGAAFHSEEKV